MLINRKIFSHKRTLTSNALMQYIEGKKKKKMRIWGKILVTCDPDICIQYTIHDVIIVLIGIGFSHFFCFEYFSYFSFQ